MGQIQYKMGIKDLMAVIILLIATKLTSDLPPALFQSMENAAWMGPIISGLIALIPFYILLKVITQFEYQNLMEVIVHVLGKYFGHFMLLILWLSHLLYIVLETASYTGIVQTMYFTRTPTIFIYGIFLVTALYGAKKGIEALGSTARLTIVSIKISLFLALIIGMTQGQLTFLFPFYGPGLFAVIKESTLKLSIFIDLLYICFLIPYMKKKKDFGKGIWIATGIIIFEISLALIVYIAVFDYKTVMLMNFPYHELIRTIHLGFLMNMEVIFFPFWLIAAFIRFAVHLYINSILFGYIANIKETQYILPVLATLIGLIGLLPESPSFTLLLLHNDLAILLGGLFFFLPIVLWIGAKLRGDFKHGKKS